MPETNQKIKQIVDDYMKEYREKNYYHTKGYLDCIENEIHQFMKMRSFEISKTIIDDFIQQIK